MTELQRHHPSQGEGPRPRREEPNPGKEIAQMLILCNDRIKLLATPSRYV
jgi:hypothetical protein